MPRAESLGPEFGRAGRRCFVLTCLLSTLILISCANSLGQPDQAVARDLETFFEAFVGHQLSDRELRELTAEFITLHTSQGKDRAAIQNVARTLAASGKTLREQKGRPADFTLRHKLLEINYFSPNLKNAIELRLFLEPDPVPVVNLRTKRLMTEKDVVALANLYHFWKSETDPQHRELSRQKIEGLIAELDRAVGNHPKAARMPKFYTETAALWTGIQQNWSSFSAQEKRQVRAYAGEGYKGYLPPSEMYAKLLGLDATAARLRRMDDLSAVALTLSEMNLYRSIVIPALNDFR